MTNLAEAREAIPQEHGLHIIETQSRNMRGSTDTVALLSQPNWEEFEADLEKVPSEADIVVSPEAITADGEESKLLPDDPKDLRSQKTSIESRERKVEDFSRNNPAMIVVLGTPTFNGHGNPYNSFRFIRGGKCVAQNNQQFYPNGRAEGFFTLGRSTGGRTARPDISAIVGVDLIEESTAFDKDTSSMGIFTNLVFVGSGVTLTQEDNIDGYAAALFKNKPINELIIVDRVPKGSSESPLNAHFVRPD